LAKPGLLLKHNGRKAVIFRLVKKTTDAQFCAKKAKKKLHKKIKKK